MTDEVTTKDRRTISTASKRAVVVFLVGVVLSSVLVGISPKNSAGQLGGLGLGLMARIACIVGCLRIAQDRGRTGRWALAGVLNYGIGLVIVYFLSKVERPSSTTAVSARVALAGLFFIAVAPIHAEDLDLNEKIVAASVSAVQEIATKERKTAVAGYVEGNDPRTGKPSKPVEFVLIEGGKFTMGTDNGSGYAKPIHEVTIEAFDISDTLVTVEQYAECVIKGKCEVARTGDRCNWGQKDRQRHPINCVTWKDAKDFAAFMGARLPSEAEYEYAATSKGKNQPYPWGMDEATCEKAVMRGAGRFSCDNDGTMPVCSKPKGNTEQGLCDMAGNVWQWTQDAWHDYAGASAWEGAGLYRVLRGGSFIDDERSLRSDNRAAGLEEGRAGPIGFRLARSRR